MNIMAFGGYEIAAFYSIYQVNKNALMSKH